MQAWMHRGSQVLFLGAEAGGVSHLSEHIKGILVSRWRQCGRAWQWEMSDCCPRRDMPTCCGLCLEIPMRFSGWKKEKDFLMALAEQFALQLTLRFEQNSLLIGRFFFSTNTYYSATWSLMAESVNVEPRMWRAYCKVRTGFPTARVLVSTTPVLFKGHL